MREALFTLRVAYQSFDDPVNPMGESLELLRSKMVEVRELCARAEGTCLCI